MADGKIKISELEEALQLSDNAEFPYSQDNGGVPTTFKAPANQIARKVAEGSTFTNLTTTAKTLVGAINELKALGSPIIIGTTAPTSSQGANGNIYVQYTEGTGDDPDTVDSIYAKIDGAWCEIETGGGSGTTDYEDLSNKPQVNSVELVGNKSLDDLGIMPASLSKTVSGSIAHFTDGADNIPVKSLVSQIVAVESGNGQPKSPDNPYTISGFANGIITRCGVNLCDEVFETGDISYVTGGNLTGASWIRSTNYIPIVSGLTIYVKSAQNINMFFYDSNKAYLGSNSEGLKQNIKNTEITISSKARYFRIATKQTSYNNDISINYPSSDTQYHSYIGNTYTFAFGQTVYGGQLIVLPDRTYFHVTWGGKDMGDLTWVRSTQYNNPIFLANIPEAKTLTASSEVANSKCEILTPTTAQNCNNTSYDNCYSIMIYFNSIYNINVVAKAYNDVPSFISAVTGKMLIYELDTPFDIDLTPVQISALVGQNNVFADCGDVEVEYYTDNADDIGDLIKSVGSGGAGGHTIVDDAGTSLTQRTNLQFKGAYSEDDSTNEKTVVNVARTMTLAEFEQLTDDEKAGFINVKDETSGSDDKFQPVIYSEEEREIGVWVDGKPLYEKTIINSNPSYTQAGSIYECNTSVDFSGVDYFMIVNATALNANSTRPVNNTRTDITAMGYVSVGKSTNVIYTAFNTDGYTKLVFTLRYTKTTDTAGSGQWTPQGVPTHHYSEDEQIIGTWIDGSTLYEKTFDLGSDINISYNSWTETSVSWQTLSVDRLVGAEGSTSSGGTFAGTLLASKKSTGNIEIQTPRNDTASGVRYLTVRYTKSST